MSCKSAKRIKQIIVMFHAKIERGPKESAFFGGIGLNYKQGENYQEGSLFYGPF